MDAIDRVHVVPLGNEFDRIVEPVTRLRADVVYLLEDPDPHVDERTYHDEIEAELADAGVEIRTRSCDLADVYDVLGEVTTIAARHEGDSVRVNVSGAGTLAAVGATIACMDVSTDATPYYVEPEEYAHDATETPISRGMAGLSELPSYPVDSPSPDQVALMTYLLDQEETTKRPKKRDLIEYAEDEELDFITERAPANDKAKFRLLDSVISPLEEDGYVEERSVGRRRVVELTEQGRNAVRAFRHKIDAAPEV